MLPWDTFSGSIWLPEKDCFDQSVVKGEMLERIQNFQPRGVFGAHTGRSESSGNR